MSAAPFILTSKEFRAEDGIPPEMCSSCGFVHSGDCISFLRGKIAFLEVAADKALKDRKAKR